MTETQTSIIESAKELFVSRGYRGTSMRDIAANAKVNLAMLNYYFRSKENLFDIIFTETIQTISTVVAPAILQEGDTLKRIERFIHLYIDELMKNPAIPTFIFQELINNPKKLLTKIQDNKELGNALILLNTQLQTDIKSGIIKPVDNPINLLLNIVSLCAFPFIAKPLIEMVTGIGSESYIGIMESRKVEITNIIQNYLKVTN